MINHHCVNKKLGIVLDLDSEKIGRMIWSLCCNKRLKVVFLSRNRYIL